MYAVRLVHESRYKTLVERAVPVLTAAGIEVTCVPWTQTLTPWPESDPANNPPALLVDVLLGSNPPTTLRTELERTGVSVDRQLVLGDDAALADIAALLELVFGSIARHGLQGAETRIAPASMTIRWDDDAFRIPPDYGGLVTVGRGSECSIRLDSDFASRLHGCIRVTPEGYAYRDMSSNGTILIHGHDEVLVKDAETLLGASGRLRIGRVELSYAVGPNTDE